LHDAEQGLILAAVRVAAPLRPADGPLARQSGPLTVHRPSGEDEPEIARFAEFVKNQTTLDDHATAYVCVNYACQEPTTDPERVVELLESRSP